MNSISKKFWQKTLLNHNATIFDAVKNLDKSGLRISLVFSNKNKLVGTVSDGDIRRALINGYKFETSIKKILKKDPIYARKEDSEKLIRILMKKNSVMQIPIISKQRIIEGLYVLKEFEQKLKKIHTNTVVIMAGGFGKRLFPYTKKIPKPMLKIAGKPIIEHIIDIVKFQGFRNIVLCLHYKKETFKRYFKNKKFSNVKITFVEEKKPMGTAGALSLIKKENSDPIIVLNGDLIFDFELENLLKFHKKQKADAAILVKTHDIQNPYGVVKSKNNLVTKFTEKPIYQSNINMGIYSLNSSILKFIPKTKKISMIDFLKKIISNKKKVFAYNTKDSWKDIGSMEQYSKYL